VFSNGSRAGSLAGLAAIKEGRITFQRIQTYTLNAIINKIVTVLFLIVGLIMTGHAILTPLLMVIVMVTGDFLSMSLTTDNVRPSLTPNSWRIGSLTVAGAAMGVCLLVFCAGVLAVGRFGMNLGTDSVRTLAFIVLVFGSQAPFMPFANGAFGVLARASYLRRRQSPISHSARHWPLAESQ
jgi:H+-transporting ATPase